MSSPTSSLRKLRLEWLESRTLLAGLGFEEALAQVTPAVSGQGDFTIGFSERIGQSELFVTGGGSGSMTIDFDRLPSFITAVTISNFDSVTFTGHDTLTKLVATDIKTLDADKITVGVGFYANNVQIVSLATGGDIAVLNGNATKLDVGDLRSTLIISDLQKLSIASETPNISIVSLNSTQTVHMLYQAEQVSVAGLANPSSQVLFLTSGESTPTGGSASGSSPTSGTSSPSDSGSTTTTETGPTNGSMPAGNTTLGADTTTSGTLTTGNVVTITPDEQTSILIARIRDILRSGSTTNPLAVVESMGQLELNLATSSAVVSARPEAYFGRTGFDAPSGIDATNAIVTQTIFLPSLSEMELRSADLLPIGPDFSEAEIHTEWIAPGPDTLVDVAPSGSLHSSATVPTSTPEDALVTREAQELFLETLPLESRTFRDVVLDGVVGEISQGERTAFLLVDPKPPRSNQDRNRESSLPEIA